jgi:hypothetical protein
MRTLQLSDEDLQTLVFVVLGFAFGLLLVLAARDLIDELVAIEDAAARRRMADLFAEFRAATAKPVGVVDADPAREALTIAAPRLKIAAKALTNDTEG